MFKAAAASALLAACANAVSFFWPAPAPPRKYNQYCMDVYKASGQSWCEANRPNEEVKRCAHVYAKDVCKDVPVE